MKLDTISLFIVMQIKDILLTKINFHFENGAFLFSIKYNLRTFRNAKREFGGNAVVVANATLFFGLSAVDRVRMLSRSTPNAGH